MNGTDYLIVTLALVNWSILSSLCKKAPNTALFSFLKQSITNSKLLGFKNIKSLVFDAFLSKTQKQGVLLQALSMENMELQYI